MTYATFLNISLWPTSEYFLNPSPVLSHWGPTQCNSIQGLVVLEKCVTSLEPLHCTACEMFCRVHPAFVYRQLTVKVTVTDTCKCFADIVYEEHVTTFNVYEAAGSSSKIFCMFMKQSAANSPKMCVFCVKKMAYFET